MLIIATNSGYDHFFLKSV